MGISLLKEEYLVFVGIESKKLVSTEPSADAVTITAFLPIKSKIQFVYKTKQ